MSQTETVKGLDAMHHVAIQVNDIAASVEWYTTNFQCEIKYQDDTWAFLGFANMSLALVVPDQHPAHIAFVHPEPEKFGTVKPHRDGTRSIYIKDPSGNDVELMAQD